MIIQIGNTGFNTEAFGDMSKSEFKKLYAGKLKGVNMDEAWEQISKYKPKRKKERRSESSDSTVD